MTDRIASFTTTNNILTNNMRIQSEYAQNQARLSSGLKDDSYEGVAFETNRILNLESDYDRLTMQSQLAQTALDRNEMAFLAVSNIIEVGQSFLQELSREASGFGLNSASMGSLAQSRLEEIVLHMNTQASGRYLFSGSATGTAPVDLAGYGGAVIPSTADTSYYQGNDYIHSVEAGDGYTVNYGVTADDTGFEQIMRALDLVRTTPTDSATLQEALSVLESGLDQLAVTKSTISEDSQALDSRIEDNLAQINLLDTILIDLKQVDLAETTIKLEELKAQLEAAYSVTTTLLRLNLSDYL